MFRGNILTLIYEFPFGFRFSDMTFNVNFSLWTYTYGVESNITENAKHFYSEIIYTCYETIFNELKLLYNT